MAALIAAIVFILLWILLSSLLDRVFPWLTVALGLAVGLAVRRAGFGLDWRFPTVAAAVTLVAAFLGNIVVAASFTAAEFGTSTLTILTRFSSLTMPTFFDEVMTPADVVFALFGAVVAAFYANRRLQRAEYHALRTWQEQRQSD